MNIQTVLDQFVLFRIKIDVIQIVVHQFVHKTSADKNSRLKKIGPPLFPGTREYVESVLTREKIDPL